MLSRLVLDNVLFLDIETVPAHATYDELNDRLKHLWDKKSERFASMGNLTGEAATPQQLYSRAGIYAEFGKIICISVGILFGDIFRIKSFAGHDEKALLSSFADLLKKQVLKWETGRVHGKCLKAIWSILIVKV